LGCLKVCGSPAAALKAVAAAEEIRKIVTAAE